MPSPPRPAGAVRRLLFTAALVLSTGDLIWTLVLLPWSTRAREIPAAELPAGRDTALVLGGSLDRRKEPTPVLADRLDVAAGLLAAGRVRRILVSGWDEEPASMRRWLLAHGVPADVIISDDGSHRTFESLARARQMFGLRDPVIVTSDFHLPRALWLAGVLGMDARGVPAATGNLRPVMRRWFWVREYLARNRAILDVLFSSGK